MVGMAYGFIWKQIATSEMRNIIKLTYWKDNYNVNSSIHGICTLTCKTREI